jgi:hypothetical protein
MRTLRRYDQRMDVMARWIIVAGVAVGFVGLALWGASRLGLGRLPGDILYERDNVRIAVPIVTSLVLSVILTIVLNIVVRVWR